MFVTYNGPVAEVLLDATGQTARVGDTIDVPDDVGARLVEQGWTPATTPSSPAPAAKRGKPADTTTTADAEAPADTQED